jgi:hypothetical protein
MADITIRLPSEQTSSQLYYTISSEGLFVFQQQKKPYLCDLWRFANAYRKYLKIV